MDYDDEQAPEQREPLAADHYMGQAVGELLTAAYRLVQDDDYAPALPWATPDPGC